MNEVKKLSWLRTLLRVLAVAYLAAFVPWIALILFDAPALVPGGSLAPFVRFQPYNAPYESMLAVIHIVWGGMLWRASEDPRRHLLFIDFTIWANVAHGLVMLVVTPLQKGLLMTMIEGLPLFVIAALLLGLRPGSRVEAAGRQMEVSRP
jgi:hypothetical protein